MKTYTMTKMSFILTKKIYYIKRGTDRSQRDNIGGNFIVSTDPLILLSERYICFTCFVSAKLFTTDLKLVLF